MNEWQEICNWIRDEADCPHDAEFELVTAKDGRLWVEVISMQLSLESYEPETNSSDPVWRTYDLISTSDRVEFDKRVRNMLSGLKRAHQTIRNIASNLPAGDLKTIAWNETNNLEVDIFNAQKWQRTPASMGACKQTQRRSGEIVVS